MNLTISQIRRAGETLKAWALSLEDDDAEITREKFDDALEVLLAYRAAYRLPLTKATMGLRSMVASEGCRVEVSQRLKRVPTIIGKLVRYPTMKLPNMQDIGGCRAVLDDVGELRRVQKRLAKNRPPVQPVNDYIEAPKPSGYRGVHVVVDYDGRKIEVQLRTQIMHQWAIAVERLGGRLQSDLKSSQGPPEVLALLEAISEAMALEEAGQTVDSSLVSRIDRLRADALPFMGGQG